MTRISAVVAVAAAASMAFAPFSAGFAPTAPASAARRFRAAGSAGRATVPPPLASPLELEEDAPDALDAYDAFGPDATRIAVRESSPGTGDVVAPGDVVTCVCDARLLGSSEVFSSSEGPRPLKLGSGNQIRGFEESLVGRRVGSKYLVRIPAARAWGKRGLIRESDGVSGPKLLVPPDTPVEFDVEVVGRADGIAGEIEMMGKGKAFRFVASATFLLVTLVIPKLQELVAGN